MKLGVVCFGLLAVTAAYGQRNNKDDNAAVKRSCGVADCFLEGDVRDFEVIDRTHLIVYTGAQRCAFHVELRGALCDLTFAPELYFQKVNEVPQIFTPRGDGRPDDILPRGGPITDPRNDPFDPFELERRRAGRRDLRICSNDLTIQVHGGRFTESASNTATDRFGNPLTDCRISNVSAITDDQLVEFYVARGVVAPPPPMGSGDIEIGEQEEQGSAPPAASAPLGRPRR